MGNVKFYDIGFEREDNTRNIVFEKDCIMHPVTLPIMVQESKEIVPSLEVQTQQPQGVPQ